jgi:hypothetical protein
VPQTSYVTNFQNAKSGSFGVLGFGTARVQNPYINMHKPSNGENKFGVSFPVEKRLR